MSPAFIYTASLHCHQRQHTPTTSTNTRPPLRLACQGAQCIILHVSKNKITQPAAIKHMASLFQTLPMTLVWRRTLQHNSLQCHQVAQTRRRGTTSRHAFGGASGADREKKMSQMLNKKRIEAEQNKIVAEMEAAQTKVQALQEVQDGDEEFSELDPLSLMSLIQQTQLEVDKLEESESFEAAMELRAKLGRMSAKLGGAL
ncbi:hypothetical protein CYMTET_52848 [Cymbomonas tetramitiformis]|uniref:Uncharacterized protein n=1 Tax=Cymbomonas tetramitiformis TaxID=36881 RepID=A0AAE0BIG3_9CHLO|nr:hypothetical protein CYMTET_52848 [Cymbomonas tetramitiformis]